MKYSVHLYALALLTLTLAYGYYWFEAKLIDAVPLDEIEVEIKKKTELPRAYLFCKHKFPDITEHGKMMLCYRRTDI